MTRGTETKELKTVGIPDWLKKKIAFAGGAKQ
jgi:hypothetical protein